MFKKIQMMAIALTMCGIANAQQSNVNLSYNPQKDTEGLVPFSASLNSPQVNDDHTVIFRIKAPQASEVKLSGAMLTVMHQRIRCRSQRATTASGHLRLARCRWICISTTSSLTA